VGRSQGAFRAGTFEGKMNLPLPSASAVRREIFVEPRQNKIPTPSGRHIPGIGR